MEYELGHKTFADLLRRHVDDEADIDARWILLEEGAQGWLEHRPPFGGNDTLRKSLRARRLLGREWRRLDALFMHTQTPALFSTRILNRTPSVLSTDGTPRNIDELGDAYLHQSGPPWREDLKCRISGAAMRSAGEVVAWSSWCANSVVDDYGVPAARVSVNFPGVELEYWTRPSTRRPGPARILFVGGDFARKGGPALLEALRDIHQEFEVDIVTRSAVDAPPGGRVHNDLSYGDSRLLRLFAEADIFAFPTKGDTFGLVIAEAMAASLPVVATATGAIPELIEDGTTGFLLAPGDVGALRASLDRLIRDPNLRHRMGSAGRRRAEASFDVRRSVERIVDAIRSQAGRRLR